MKQSLRRILRFRQLAEEQARLELERAVHRLRRASEACEQQTDRQREQRVSLEASWRTEQPHEEAGGSAQQEDAWRMAEASLAVLEMQRKQLEQVRQAEVRRSEPVLARYQKCRRELRQTEQLLNQQEAILAAEEDRRAQAEIDAWFLQSGWESGDSGEVRGRTGRKKPQS